jgi:hypothetical protein
MSSTVPTELSAAVIIERLEAGILPRDLVETVARGFLPLPQADLVPVLSYLTQQPDPAIAAMAHASLSEIPSRIVHGFASDEHARPDHLALLMRASQDPVILEALIRNRAVPDDDVAELARRAEAAVQEIVVINQARILRAPQILDALLQNPHLSAEARRRALETREEFFEKKARLEAARIVDEDEVDESLPAEPIADLLARAAEEDARHPAPQPPAVPESELQQDDKKMTIFTKIMFMTVQEKVLLAYRGGKTERMILVRDHNRLICAAAVRNPRISESEVEAIAGMRMVEDEVLRIIGMRRDWMAKPAIANVLAHNPKAPVGVVLPIVNRLTLRELKNLKDDRNVPEVVRVTARKLFIQRSQKS